MGGCGCWGCYGISSSLSRPCRSYLQLSSTHRCGEKAGPLCNCKCRTANELSWLTGTGSAFSPRYVNNCANPSIWLDVENFINFYWALLFDIWVINDVAIDIVIGTFKFNFILLLQQLPNLIVENNWCLVWLVWVPVSELWVHDLSQKSVNCKEEIQTKMNIRQESMFQI